MGITIYDNSALYIESKTDLRAKIAAINQVINALETVALKAAATGNISEYELNDGQTKIRTMYRDAGAVAKSITDFERIKQRYINQLNGRSVRLVDSKSFNC
jgi:hypothetical protein